MNLKKGQRLQSPIVPTWNANDMIPAEHPNYAAGPGCSGNTPGISRSRTPTCSRGRVAHVDPTDWLNATLFARHAKLVMVDIDENEMFKQSLRWICRSSPMQSSF